MTFRIDRVLTAGNSDPAGPPVHENNTWLVGDDNEVIVIDPAHGGEAIEAALSGRKVLEVVLTHGHWDHIRAAAKFASDHGLVARLNPADQFLWAAELGDAPFAALDDGDVFTVGGVLLEAIHTPGHTPGSTSFLLPSQRTVFSGDTLFPGGPGATRWDYSGFDQIIGSIRGKLFTLPDDWSVFPGHGDNTTIGAERPALESWIVRGW